MSVSAKICGISDRAGLEAAITGGAAYTGFVFFEQSRNAINPIAARDLMLHIPEHVIKTGLFVDASDDDLRMVLAMTSLDLLQLHGNETPRRVAEIKALTDKPVMKALRLKTVDQFEAIADYESVVDRFLFDSRIGNEASGGPLDWALFKGRTFGRPWMLAGGLNAHNLAEAVTTSGATAVDVSSGVEDASGHKSPEKIRAFLAVAAGL